MKKVLLVLLFILSTSAFISCKAKTQAKQEPQVPVQQKTDSSVFEQTFLYDKDAALTDTKKVPFGNSNCFEITKAMGAGWNLGNTFDATGTTGMDSETSWGQPLTTKAMIDGLAASGIKTIRIPVSWAKHITDKTNYTISREWMERVKTVVDWAIQDGLYVIINSHHDNYFTSTKMPRASGYYPNSTNLAESQRFLYNVWGQIAQAFNNGYDEHLIFETMNEPRNTAHEHCWSPEPKTCEECKKDLELLNECNQLILDTIRASGGNNANRFVMIPANGTSIGTALTDDFKMPRDSASGKLMVTVHDYPLDSGGTGSNSHHFDTSTKNHFIDTLTALNDKYVAKGIPVVIGECGASRKAGTDWTTGKPVTDYVVTYDDRLNCFSYLASLAGKYSMPLINWDCGGKDGMATINRNDCSVYEPEYNKAVIKAWQDANKNPSSVSNEINDEELDLTLFKVWDTNVSSYDKTTKKLKMGAGYKGGDIYFGAKSLANFSQLKLSYKNASADFTVTLGYTDDTEEKVTAKASSSSVIINVDKNKIAKILMLMSQNEAVSFELEEIKFSK